MEHLRNLGIDPNASRSEITPILSNQPTDCLLNLRECFFEELRRKDLVHAGDVLVSRRFTSRGKPLPVKLAEDAGVRTDALPPKRFACPTKCHKKWKTRQVVPGFFSNCHTMSDSTAVPLNISRIYYVNSIRPNSKSTCYMHGQGCLIKCHEGYEFFERVSQGTTSGSNLYPQQFSKHKSSQYMPHPCV